MATAGQESGCTGGLPWTDGPFSALDFLGKRALRGGPGTPVICTRRWEIVELISAATLDTVTIPSIHCTVTVIQCYASSSYSVFHPISSLISMLDLVLIDAGMMALRSDVHIPVRQSCHFVGSGH